MSVDLLLVAVALVSAVVIVAGVLIVGDFQEAPQQIDGRRREPRIL